MGVLFSLFLQRRKLKFKNMKKFPPSHTARECWSFNSNLDFSDSKIHFSEEVTLELCPEERERLAQCCMENEATPNCYNLNICVPLKFMYWNLILECDGIKRWRHWKVIRSCELYSHEGTSALIKEAWRSYLALLPCEDTATTPHLWGRGPYQTVNLLEPWAWISQPPERWAINIS